jgi:hypothetical protein
MRNKIRKLVDIPADTMQVLTAHKDKTQGATPKSIIEESVGLVTQRPALLKEVLELCKNRGLITTMLLVFTLSFTQAQPTTFGYNNSRIIDQMTDDAGQWIPAHYKAIAAIQAPMRFPGGTVSRYYSIDCGGYDCRGKQYSGVNAAYYMASYCRQTNTPIALVLNVGRIQPQSEFFWDMCNTPECWAQQIDENRRMIQVFVDSGVQILFVELGNEEYLHRPRGNYRPANFRYNFIQRLLGEPNRDAAYRNQIDGIFAMYAEAYKRNKALVDSFGYKTAIPMVANEAAVFKQWNETIKNIRTDYGVFHHYETSTDQRTWAASFDAFLLAIRAQKRVPICTEYNFNFGDNGANSLKPAFDGLMWRYQDWFRDYAARKGVPYVFLHRLNGNPATWQMPANERDVVPNQITPYDWRR